MAFSSPLFTFSPDQSILERYARLEILLRERFAVNTTDMERARPALPGYGQRTPFDNFKDFVVSSDCAVESQPNGCFGGLRLDGCGEFKAPTAI